jgi:hypothetical protein
MSLFIYSLRNGWHHKEWQESIGFITKITRRETRPIWRAWVLTQSIQLFLNCSNSKEILAALLVLLTKANEKSFVNVHHHGGDDVECKRRLSRNKIWKTLHIWYAVILYLATPHSLPLTKLQEATLAGSEFCCRFDSWVLLACYRYRWSPPRLRSALLLQGFYRKSDDAETHRHRNQYTVSKVMCTILKGIINFISEIYICYEE